MRELKITMFQMDCSIADLIAEFRSLFLSFNFPYSYLKHFLSAIIIRTRMFDARLINPTRVLSNTVHGISQTFPESYRSSLGSGVPRRVQ